MNRAFFGCLILLVTLPANARAQTLTITNYGIYTVNLANPQVSKPIRVNPNKEMSHPRFSPDATRITYTLYNGANGNPANEDYGYTNTEIHVCNADGSGDRTVVPAVPTGLNANSSWVDNNTLVWVSMPPSAPPQLKVITVSTGATLTISTPAGIFPADPHIVGSRLVYTSIGTTQPLRVATYTGTTGINLRNDRQLTNPAPGQQDYDPRISPDGTKVAFMRFMGGTTYHLVTVTIPPSGLGVESDLTAGSVASNAVPDWSSDGQTLVYRYINGTGTQPIVDNTQGIWTVVPKTNQKSEVSLARGPVFNHPSFRPAGNRPPNTLIYCARTYNVTFP
jgi:Tol biopolymer transport system component